MTPPLIEDSDGWPFRLLGRVPYQPTDHEDWRAGIIEGLSSAADRAGLRSFHGGNNGN